MLELYHHGSSACAAKVRFALAQKALEWKGHYIDILKGEQFTEQFLEINPKAVVPVLVHDGQVIPESTVICEYIEDSFPENPILPESAYARALVRQWTRAVDEELHPACSALTYIVSHRHTILRNGAMSFEEFLSTGGAEGRSARERKWRWIQQGIEAPGAVDYIRIYVSFLSKMDQALARSRWLAGESLTLADIAMAPYLYRLACLALDSLWADNRLLGVTRWYQEISSMATFNAAFVEWMPADLGEEMLLNGTNARPRIDALLAAGA